LVPAWQAFAKPKLQTNHATQGVIAQAPVRETRRTDINRPTRRSRTNTQSLQSKTTPLIPSYPLNPYLNSLLRLRNLGDGVGTIGDADFDKTMTDQLGDFAVYRAA
jgi:hypothetical protein